MAAVSRWALVLAFSGMLIACGGSEKTPSAALITPVDGTPTPPAQAPAPVDAPALIGEYSGVAMKGMLDNALVVAEWFNGGLWQELDRSHTQAGRFLLDIGQIEGLIRLTVTNSQQRVSTMVCDVPAGCAGALLGESVLLADDFSLSALLSAQQFRDGRVAVTPLTHLAAQWAQQMPGGLTEFSMALASERVAALFDLPTNFIHLLPADPADANSFAGALESARFYGALTAAFAAQGEDQSVATVINAFASAFRRYAGQLPLQGSHGMLALVEAAQDITEALEQPVAGFEALKDRLHGWGNVSAVGSALNADWDKARFAALTNELDYYASGAALLDLDAAIRQQAGQYLWLPRAEIPAMLQVAYTSLGHALDAAVNGERKLIEANSQCALWRPNRCYTYVVLHQDDDYSAIMRAFPSITDLLGFLTGGSISPRVEIIGTLHGQNVDINLRVPTPGSQLFSGGLSRVQMEVIHANVANDTAISTLSGVMALGLPGLDLLDFFAALTPLMESGDDPLALAANLLNVLGVVSELRLSVDGSGTLAPVAAPQESFRGQVDLHTTLGIAALLGGEGGLLGVRLNSGEIETPLGDRLFSLPGQPGLVLDIGPTMALAVAFGVALDDLPEMHLALGGSLETGDVWSWGMGMVAALLSGSQPEIGLPSLAGLSLSGAASLEWPGLSVPYDVSWRDGGLLFNQAGSSEAGLRLLPATDRGGYLMLGEQLIATLTLDASGAGLAAYFIDGDQHALSAAPLLALIGWSR